MDWSFMIFPWPKTPFALSIFTLAPRGPSMDSHWIPIGFPSERARGRQGGCHRLPIWIALLAQALQKAYESCLYSGWSVGISIGLWYMIYYDNLWYIIIGHFRNLPLGLCKGIYPQNIWPYGTTPHFRILEFPLTCLPFKHFSNIL
jgi:hypothetical protein